MGFMENFYAALSQDSQQVSGTQTAPAADTAIATLSLAPGVWEICAYASYGGVAGNFDDMKLRNNTAATDFLSPLPIAAAANSQPIPITVRRKLLVTSSISVRNIGAGPATSVYRAVLLARMLESVNL